MVHIPYTSQLFRENGHIVAICPELNVSSFADTPPEAITSLKEAVALFLEGCQEMGSLEAVLEEAGYHRDSTNGQRWVARSPGDSHAPM